MRPKYWVDGSSVMHGDYEADIGIVWPAEGHTDAAYICTLLNQLDALKTEVETFKRDVELTNTHENHMLLCRLNAVLDKVHV